MSVDVAGAPVSFGVFELTDPDALEGLPGPDRVCQVLSEAGYAGIDLGPVGFLGRGAELRERLTRWGLGLAGGWIDLPFSDDERFTASLGVLDNALAAFTEAAEAPSPRAALPTLADSGDAMRQANPGGTGSSLTGDALERFAANVQTTAARVRSVGLEPTFHHHMGTYVETPEEIDAFLAATDVDLTFDTGHLLLGGGDPLAGWRRWRSRINHVHLKDVDLAKLHDVQARRGGMVDVWAARAFVPFGDGDLALEDIVRSVQEEGFDGWIVVEQDVLPSTTTRVETLEQDQILNKRRLDVLLARGTAR